MTSNPARWSGAAAILGGVLWLVLLPLITLTYPGRAGWGSTDTLLGLAWEDYNRMLPLVVLPLLAGLVGLRGQYAPRAGKLGKAGFALALAGFALMLAGNVVEFWVAGGIRDHRATLDLMGWTAYSLGYLLLATGLVLLGLGSLRARVFPRWNGMPLFIGLLVLPMFVTVTSGMSVGAVLSVLFGLVWVALGYFLSTSGTRQPVTRQVRGLKDGEDRRREVVLLHRSGR